MPSPVALRSRRPVTVREAASMTWRTPLATVTIRRPSVLTRSRPMAAACPRRSAGEQQAVVAAEPQVHRLTGRALARGAEVQATGPGPRGRVDELETPVGGGVDPGATGLAQVKPGGRRIVTVANG